MPDDSQGHVCGPARQGHGRRHASRQAALRLVRHGGGREEAECSVQDVGGRSSRAHPQGEAGEFAAQQAGKAGDAGWI